MKPLCHKTLPVRPRFGKKKCSSSASAAAASMYVDDGDLDGVAPGSDW
jgi:hypothetical protein